MPDGVRCLSDDDVAGFVAGGLTDAEHEALCAHIDGCVPCRRLISAMVGGAAVPDPLDVHPGQVLGRFVVTRWIGRGAMGQVWAAQDPELGREVALKLLRVSVAIDSEAAQRMRREAQAMARLSHPNVVAIYELYRSEGRVFCAMQLVEGVTLRAWLETPRPWRDALAVARAVGRGVEAAHTAGLVHRDIKPENVLIDRDGRALVSDFGLAKLVDPVPETANAGTSSPATGLIGTPRYMAPEQLAGRGAGARSDQFSYCVTIHEALFGRHPFEGARLAELPAATRRGPVRPADLGGVPEGVLLCLQRGLAADPEARWPSMTSLLAALDRAAERPRRRKRALVVGVLGVAMAALVAMVVVPANTREATAPPALAMARALIRTNPSRAVALVRPLALGAWWREARAIIAASRAAGVPWRHPGPAHAAGILMSPSGRQLAAKGSDHSLRIIDLVTHAARDLAPLAGTGQSRVIFIDEDHLLVDSGGSLVRIDIASDRRETIDHHPMLPLLARHGMVYGTDAAGHLWRLGPDDPAPRHLAFDQPVHAFDVNPEGSWLAAAAGDRLWLLDLVAGAVPRPLADGHFTSVEFSADEPTVSAVLERKVMTFQPPSTEPVVVELDTPQMWATRAGGILYAWSWGGLSIDRGVPTLAGNLMIPTVGDGGVVTFGGPDHVAVSDRSNQLVVDVPETPVIALAASPNCRFVAAQTDGAIFVWNLDDMMPRHIPLPKASQLGVAGSHDVVIIDLVGPARRIDLATGAVTQLPAMEPSTFATSATGRTTLVRSYRGTVSVLAGGDLEPLAARASAATLIDDARAVVASPEGDVTIIDLATKHATPMFSAHQKVVSVRANPAWVVVRFADGLVWRRELATGHATTTTILEPIPVSDPGRDGTVWLARGSALVAWAPDGTLAERGHVPGAIASLARLDDHHVLVTATDGASFFVDLDRPDALAPMGVVPGAPTVSEREPRVVAFTNREQSTTVIDGSTGQSWLMAHTAEDPTIQLTEDGRYLFGRAHRTLEVWPVELPETPLGTLRSADVATNAAYDAENARLIWR